MDDEPVGSGFAQWFGPPAYLRKWHMRDFYNRHRRRDAVRAVRARRRWLEYLRREAELRLR